jgi:signal transduction histidine kinase/ActR/RegA family two-component response regulator
MDARILILAPTGRDASLAAGMFRHAGFESLTCRTMDDLLAELELGAGALLLAEEALSVGAQRMLVHWLRQQPSWSDLPIILITGTRDTDVPSLKTISSLDPLGNVALLERPVRVVALLSAIKTALRARRRQYEVRDYLAEKQRAEAEHRRLLAAEQAARAEGEAANRAKDDFLAVLSHELRTPLQSMLGWLKMLRSGRLDEAGARRAIETIERGARAQAQLIEDLLDVSRIVAGKLRVELKRTVLAPTVDAAVDAVRGAAEAKGITIRIDLDPEPAVVMGDAVRLQQIIWNLLSNATKFTPEQGRVEVALRRTGTHAVIVVSDTGPGIAPDLRPHIFQRFRQADSTHTRPHGGLGLGLAIVRHLVELHHGSIAVDAGDGGGARFTVTLPLRVESVVGSHDAAGERDGALAPLTLSGLTVLVVEDDAATREVLMMMLATAGATVRAAGSVDDALRTIQWLRPDIVVSDISMPGEDGYSLMRKLRAVERGRSPLPAIALTAHARPEDTEQAFVAGFAEHLAKPVDAPDLVSAIARVTGRAPGGARRERPRRWLSA